MNKFKLFLGSLICLVGLLFSMQTLSAQSLVFSDDFDYTPGNLIGQGDWIQEGSSGGENIINVLETGLSYPQYAENTGKSIHIQGISGQKARHNFTAISSTFYMSALLKVDSAFDGSNPGMFIYFSIEGKTTQIGKICALRGSDSSKFKLAVVRSTSKYTYGSELNCGETYLMVFKYEQVEGGANDVLSLWINPDMTSEAGNTVYTTNGEEYGSGSEMSSISSIVINQAKGFAGTTPAATIDALRIATSWKALFGNETETDAPQISVSPTSLNFGSLFETFEAEKTFTVRAKNLKGNVRLLSDETNIRLDKTSFSVDEMASPQVVTATLLETRKGDHDTIFIVSEDADTLRLAANWTDMAVSKHSNLASLRRAMQSPEHSEYTYYLYTGQAVVSFVNNNEFYIQDDSAALTVKNPFDIVHDATEGLLITKLLGNLESNFGSTSLSMMMNYVEAGRNQTVVPTEITLADLKATPLQYESRLIKLSEVELPNRNNSTEGAGVFTSGKQVSLSQGEIAATEGYKLRILAGMDFIGDSIPAKADLIGISTAGSGKLIAPRSKADIVKIGNQEEPEPSYPNLLSNPSFEEWDAPSPFFGDRPAVWSVQGSSQKETSLVKDGEFALKITEGGTKYNGVSQEISNDGLSIMAGKKYQMSFWYYVESGTAEGTDIRVKSSWMVNGDVSDADATVLASEEWFTSVGKWSKKSIETTAPMNADGFYFSVGSAKGVVVIYDHFSFRQMEDDTKSLYVTPTSFLSLKTHVDTAVYTDSITIVATNLTQPLTLSVRGDNPEHFSVETTTLEVTSKVFTHKFVVKYLPTAAGRHFAQVEISSPETGKAVVELVGQATVFTEPGDPRIELSETSLLNFSAKVGESMDDTIVVNTFDLEDYVYVRSVGEDRTNFILSSTMLPKELVDFNFKITYRPKSVGEHRVEIQFISKNADTAKVIVQGVGLPKDSVTDPELHREIKLDPSNPQKLWIENFDGKIGHNKAIHDSVMQNVVPLWDRPWWGFEERNGEDEVIGQYAKATAYTYQANEQKPVEMWLISPALDFKNAQSKILTFSVMGDFMFEGHETKLELFYLEKYGDEIFKTPLDVAMPSSPDENKDWRNYQADFEGQDLADVFFIGFRFTGLCGSENSVVYYVDNLSFGRTDLAKLSANVQNLSFNTPKETSSAPQTVEIKGQNISSGIQISVLGANPSRFNVSTKTLENEGGSFEVTFNPMDEGLHTAYLKISAKDAADIIIPMEGRTTTGVETIAGNNSLYIGRSAHGICIISKEEMFNQVEVFSASGQKIYANYSANTALEIHLKQKGIYLVKVRTDKQTIIQKVIR